jgi:hypothetical protein
MGRAQVRRSYCAQSALAALLVACAPTAVSSGAIVQDSVLVLVASGGIGTNIATRDSAVASVYIIEYAPDTWIARQTIYVPDGVNVQPPPGQYRCTVAGPYVRLSRSAANNSWCVVHWRLAKRAHAYRTILQVVPLLGRQRGHKSRET